MGKEILANKATLENCNKAERFYLLYAVAILLSEKFKLHSAKLTGSSIKILSLEVALVLGYY